MIKQIRTSKFTKVVAYYLALMICLEVTQPMQMYALTGGPAQPEFNSFTPIGTSDMVDLSSGDFNYNIPVMDVGGYPLNLAYNSGATMDQEASWVGMGWDLNAGQINRQMRGLPDDFNGDKMTYENNMKDNTTIGGNVNIFISPFGVLENMISFGMGIKYNNYEGFGFSINGGLSYQISDNLSVGMNLESSSTDGVTASPSVSFHDKDTQKTNQETTVTGSLGVSMNSRKGVETVTMSASRSKQATKKEGEKTVADGDRKTGSIGGAISFVDASFTPTKRVGMASSNFMFSVNLESAVMGVDPGVKFSGYRNTQGIKDSEKFKIEKGFGYENTHSATQSDVLDFNREKDRTVTKNTLSLPMTNYTYDIYSVQGQGVSGMFRPYRSQVGFIFDNYTQDDSFGGSLGGEIGAGVGTHFGVDATVTDSQSSTGLWTNGNSALYRTMEKKTGNKPDYEKVFFKNIGGNHVDKELDLFMTNLGGYEPITFKLNGSKFSRGLDMHYYGKLLRNNSAKPLAGSSPYLKRDLYRLSRNQAIQKLNRKEASRFGFKTKFSPYSKRGIHDHHTSEIRILKEGGDHYIYGRAAYNSVKREVTFDMSGRPGDCQAGLITYNPGAGDNSSGNKRDGDRYFNRITTPPYAHTYLLTSVLSSDYQDISFDGPSDDDLGTYTKFSYTSKNKKVPYKWRVPYDENMANYDEGLRSLNKDNKGNYQYGEKELLYVNKIETKTHVAIFTLSARKDGYGVKGENGGADMTEPSKMWKLDKVSLYSKPEYMANPEGAIPIKEAHFVYDYSLCKNVKNNFHEAPTAPAEIANQGGKLTLKKMYFTYRDSKMGKYTPYNFNYDEQTNFDYDQKAYDIWGNYKPTKEGVGCGTNDEPSNAEFGYVDQSSKQEADKYASAWLLKSIDLPSGGTMEMTYESDDYKYVQNREVLQMFNVVGVAENPNDTPSTNLYDNKRYMFIRLPDNYYGDGNGFFQTYLSKLVGKPVYFRFMVNMTNPSNDNSDKYDYVTGYLNVSPDRNEHRVVPGPNGEKYGAIRVTMVGDNLNPVTKAGFYFGRQNLNSIMYSLTGNEDVNDIKGVVMSLANLVPDLLNIFRSPDTQLIEKRIASRFVPKKSFMRLMCPKGMKYGGGSRVKEIKMHDSWDVMTEHPNEAVYKQFYGQEYSYTKTGEGGLMSSGVATYEPLGSKENPFVEPFYDHSRSNVLLGPDTQNYVELPFGESFFPSPKVTYSKVTVKNLARTNSVNPAAKLKRHATGEVVSEFFTSYDYPTISDYTLLDPRFDPSPLGSILNIYARTHLSMSQGFSVHTNDMDGKPKAQWVYAEGQVAPISGMEYKYEQNADETANPNSGKLNNKVVTVDAKGKISEKLVAVDYDVINDFRENKSVTETAGIHFNTAGLPLAIVFIIVPVPLPSYSYHENVLRTAVTTKTIHTSGILRETIAYTDGAKVSTKNLAWDADSGEILLTETVNEYNDKYYNFNFPAYWAYDGMSQSVLNLGLEWKITSATGNAFRFTTDNAGTYLKNGDVLYVTSKINKKGFKAWVVGINGSTFKMIDAAGMKVLPSSIATEGADIKVIRSANRNLQASTMASVTSMKNPLYFYNGNTMTTRKTDMDPSPFLSTQPTDFRIVNASAVEFKDVWAAQCECGLPKMTYNDQHELSFEYQKESTDDIDIIAERSFNPYLYNILGNWRAVRSYAYLTGRNSVASPTPRTTGFFMDFKPLYTFGNGKWQVNNDNKDRWTFASEISQYNPYGQEVENKDALNRYSSAYFGYNNRFPTAVASNTKYSELAFDGFEDYDFTECAEKSHFSFQETLLQYNISITDKQAHSGRKSIRLEPGKKNGELIIPNVSSIRKKITYCAATGTPPEKTALASVKAAQKTPAKTAANTTQAKAVKGPVKKANTGVKKQAVTAKKNNKK